MSKHIRIILIFLALTSVTHTWAGRVRNSLPTVSLTSPVNGSSFAAPATIALTATAADADGTILRVDFYQGTVLIGTDSVAPYSLTWSNAPGGTYSLKAIATDNLGASTTSAAAGITVTGAKVIITAPANGATLYGGATTVTGTFNGDASTTILVDNGTSTRLAKLINNTYSATLPIFLGQNTLTVSVARIDKTSDKAIITVTGNDYPKIAFRAPTSAAFDAPANLLFAVDAVSPASTISKVEFYRNGTLTSTVNSPPYQYTLANALAQSYTIQAKAIDSFGYASYASTTVTGVGPNALPTAIMTAPLNGANYTAPANITLIANASDPDGSIAGVEFFQNGVLLGGTNFSPYRFNWLNVPAGSYTLTAKATDNRNGTATTAPVNISVTPPNAPPAVSLTRPVTGFTAFAPANVTLSANAADSDGSVTQVDFYQGTTLIGTATTAPYTFNWANVAAGSYSLTAKATDNLGGTATTSPLTITVNPLSVTIISPASGVSISGNSVLVQGSSQAPAYSGITVNGVIAIVDSDGNFHANNVPLTTGSNTLTATVTTLDENTVSSSTNLTASAAGINQTTVAPIEGISTLPATIKVSNPNLIQRVDIDFEGNGSIDFTTTGWAGFTPGQSEFAVTLTYSTAGIYKPIITVTDMLGNVSSDQFVLQVHDPVVMDQMFTDLWARMKDKLRADDIPVALTSFSGGVRNKYQAVFTALQPNLASIVDQLGILNGANLGIDMTEYLIVRTSGSGTKAYPMYFIRSEDGVWRVDGM